MGSVLQYVPRPRAGLSCRTVIESLDELLEGSLTRSRRGRFEAHLSGCDACRRYAREYEETIRIGQRAFAPADDEAEAEVPAAMIGAILRACRKA
jgi:anti-sigma factor RsiW